MTKEELKALSDSANTTNGQGQNTAAGMRNLFNALIDFMGTEVDRSIEGEQIMPGMFRLNALGQRKQVYTNTKTGTLVGGGLERHLLIPIPSQGGGLPADLFDVEGSLLVGDFLDALSNIVLPLNSTINVYSGAETAFNTSIVATYQGIEMLVDWVVPSSNWVFDGAKYSISVLYTKPDGWEQ